MDRTTRQEIIKKTRLEECYQLGLTDICRTDHSTTAEHTFFSEHMEHSRVDHMAGHKTKPNKHKRIGIKQGMFSVQNGTKLEITSRRKFGTFTMCGN